MLIGTQGPSSVRNCGYSLVELMISIVLGMIVIGSVITLVVAVITTNAQTIRSTRLTQELRTLMEVIGRDAERARLMSDPISNIGNPPDPANPALGPANPNTHISDNDPTNDCLQFSYADPDTGTNRAVTFAFRNNAIFAGENGNAPLVNWTDPDGNVRQRTELVACNAATVRLSSPEITVSDFVVEVLDDRTAAGTEDPTLWVDCNQGDSILALQVEGSLAADADVQRRVTDRIRIGSTDLKLNPVCYN